MQNWNFPRRKKKKNRGDYDAKVLWNPIAPTEWEAVFGSVPGRQTRLENAPDCPS